jgi:hypothetical protein
MVCPICSKQLGDNLNISEAMEQQKGLVVVALADIDRFQRQRNGFSRRGIGPCGGLSAPCLAAQVQKHADKIFHVLGPQAEINRTLLAVLDLQADGFAVWRNVADDVHDKRRQSAASLFFMGCQSCLPGPLFSVGASSENALRGLMIPRRTVISI